MGECRSPVFKLRVVFVIFSVLGFNHTDAVCRELKFLPKKDKDFALKNHVVEEKIVDGDSQCRVKCYLHVDCHTYNIGPSSVPEKYTCQVNSADKHSHPKDYKSTPGFYYHELYENPCRSNPCFVTGTRLCQVGYDGFQCACKQSFKGKLCSTDVDECADNLHNCSSNAQCTNTYGSFKCSCKPGYEGEAVKPGNCTYINECVLGRHDCSNGTVCKDLPWPEKFTCGCPQGYNYKEGKCEDVDECADNSNCDTTYANCTNTMGSYNCTCKLGFTGSGKPRQCFGNGLSKSSPGNNCLKIKEKFPSSADGAYWIDTDMYNGNHDDEVKVYCDMTIKGGGWTMVWSYTFAKWKPTSSFKEVANHVYPTPKGYSDHGTIATRISFDPNSPGALPFAQWDAIGNAFLIKSNINNWIYCHDDHSTQISTKIDGQIRCEMVKEANTTCSSIAVATAMIMRYDDCGFTLGIFHFPTDVNPMYRLETCDDKYWPIHDPCAQNMTNHDQSPDMAMGQLYLRYE